VTAGGTSSDAASLPFDPFVSRTTIRLTTVYATPWRCLPERLAEHASPVTNYLRFGRLARFYDASQDQFPRVLTRVTHTAETSYAFRRWRQAEQVRAGRSWLFTLSAGQVLAAVTFDVTGSLRETIPLLEDLYYGDVTVDARTLPEEFAALVEPELACEHLDRGFYPERHQFVFAAAGPDQQIPNDDEVQRLIYRADLPYVPRYSSIRYPAELNRRPNALGAVGPYVSMLIGQQDYVENCVLLSGVQAVGSSARLHQIREQTYESVRSFRASGAEYHNVRQRRLLLEDLADTLGDLELDLSFSVEATADLGLLVPSLRIEGYHDELYDAMSLSRRSDTTGHMLTRLRNAIEAELTAVESVERRADDRKRLRTATAVTFVTTVAGTLSLLFGFFGINATQVNQNQSMFSAHYLGIYLLIAGLVLTGATVFLLLYIYERRQAASDQRRQFARLPLERDGRAERAEDATGEQRPTVPGPSHSPV
jgi:hypothetical protein